MKYVTYILTNYNANRNYFLCIFPCGFYCLKKVNNDVNLGQSVGPGIREHERACADSGSLATAPSAVVQAVQKGDVRRVSCIIR